LVHARGKGRQEVVAPLLNLDAPTTSQDNSDLQKPAPIIEQPTINNIEEPKVEPAVLEKGFQSPFSGSLFGDGNFPNIGGGL